MTLMDQVLRTLNEWVANDNNRCDLLQHKTPLYTATSIIDKYETVKNEACSSSIEALDKLFVTQDHRRISVTPLKARGDRFSIACDVIFNKWEFDVQCIEHVGSIIQGLHSNYRKTPQCIRSCCFLPPPLIEGRLNQLVDFVNNQLQQKNNIIQVICIVAVFLNEWLRIRPFEDGNLRSAKILANVILSKVLVSPVQIFLDFSDIVSTMQYNCTNKKYSTLSLGHVNITCKLLAAVTKQIHTVAWFQQIKI